ncbi:MAG: GntR family transcriptional regulator [Thermoleophilia bacterium]|nr:GntR family transcriptional regulator [Thermoleophilia bacterium]
MAARRGPKSDGSRQETPRAQRQASRTQQHGSGARQRACGARAARVGSAAKTSGRAAQIEEEKTSDGVPVYLEIARVLADRVSSGKYAPGSRLPSGAELCAEFDVSPMTLRRALARLQNQGLIKAVRGKGTFVRSPSLGDSLFRLDPLSGHWLDESAEIRLLSAAMTRADEKVARMLQIRVNERVIFMRRLVLHDNVPAMYHSEYIVYDPRRPLVESQLKLTSMSVFLDPGRAHSFPRGELTLTAVTLSEEDARVLGDQAGALALRLEHVFQEADGTPISWGWFLLKAELFRLRARIGPD